jgi:glucosamine-6-phosphate deaminase
MGDNFPFQLASFLPFRDRAACDAVRGIKREDITKHSNPAFRIRVIDGENEFYRAFAQDLVDTIRNARDEHRKLTLILPLGPVPQYGIAAELINSEGLSLDHVTTFNMDEYSDEYGRTAGIEWPGSFQHAMWREFFGAIEEKLRPPVEHIHFPTTDVIANYSDAIAEAGSADVCYGGIGWSGHIAFWEPHLAAEFAGDFKAYRSAGARNVELHPMTIMQNALHSFGGDWSSVPPKANTIGPRDILGARRRSFWLDGALGGGASWQRFIARLVAHGPVSEFVPGSLLQEAGADFTLLGPVADDVKADHR